MTERMNFKFPDVTAMQLVHVQFRRELHGPNHVHAVDLRLLYEGGNEVLDMLAPGLRETHYYNKAALPGQEALPNVLIPLPNLRHPELNGKKFAWLRGMRAPGYRATLDYGLGEEGGSNVDLEGCKVTGWVYETCEGGTVRLWFTVQYAGEQMNDGAVRGKLAGLTDEAVHLQLLPPAVLQLVRGAGKKARAADGQQQLPDGNDEQRGAEDDTTGGDDTLPAGSPEAALAGTAEAGA